MHDLIDVSEDDPVLRFVNPTSVSLIDPLEAARPDACGWRPADSAAGPGRRATDSRIDGNFERG
jgi:hypothetical protein